MKQQNILMHIGITAENVKVDFSKVQEFKAGIVKKLTGGVEGLLKGNKVDIVRGEAYFVDGNSLSVMGENSSQTYNFKNAIIATGSRPIELPTFKYSKRVLNSTGALNLQEVPEKIVVIGGGVYRNRTWWCICKLWHTSNYFRRCR